MSKDPYKIILRPVITEKSSWLKEKNREVCFEVDSKANKIEIKEAAEKLFKVKVDRVMRVVLHIVVVQELEQVLHLALFPPLVRFSFSLFQILH